MDSDKTKSKTKAAKASAPDDIVSRAKRQQEANAAARDRAFARKAAAILGRVVSLTNAEADELTQLVEARRDKTASA